MTISHQATTGYPLGHSDAETRRLILQNKIFGPLTRRFLTDAGITAGMRVLDIGCGAGDVSLQLAEIVGPQGQVVGIDVNDSILEAAQARAEVAGWMNIHLRHGDIHTIDAHETFDAVVGRWVLMYLPDPADVLRRCTKHLGQGGIVAFQESDLTHPPRAYPPGPLHANVARWLSPPITFPDLEMGPKLFQTFIRAGLPGPQLRLDSVAGGGPDWPGYRYVTETLRSLLPFLQSNGTITADELDLETLTDRLRAEVNDRDGYQILSPLIGAWARG